MPIEFEEDEPILELNLRCQECSIEYSVCTRMDGYLEQARYCPFCGTYNIDYDLEGEE